MSSLLSPQKTSFDEISSENKTQEEAKAIPKSPLPKIAILLGTYQAESYLAEQLDSYANQIYTNWELWVSDDGSQDKTHDILESYKKQFGHERLVIQSGPAQGFTANFLSLACHPDIQADYYAYSDQDDIWEADKLQRAADWLQTIPENVPALYCARTRLVDPRNVECSLSQLFPKPPGFANALVQNIAGGNTMVFNHAARLILCEAGANVKAIAHDWWTYMVISGCGGKIFYDLHPSVRYRQHDNNLIGQNLTPSARIERIGRLLKGEFRRSNDRHFSELQKIRAYLTPANQKLLDQFNTGRNHWLLPRLFKLKQSGIYRQTAYGNLGLMVAAILRKI